MHYISKIYELKYIFNDENECINDTLSYDNVSKLVGPLGHFILTSAPLEWCQASIACLPCCACMQFQVSPCKHMEPDEPNLYGC